MQEQVAFQDVMCCCQPDNVLGQLPAGLDLPELEYVETDDDGLVVDMGTAYVFRDAEQLREAIYKARLSPLLVEGIKMPPTEARRKKKKKKKRTWRKER